MAKKNKNIEMDNFNIDDARVALDKLEAKLETLTEAVEKRLAEEKRGMQRAPAIRTKIEPVPMPTDIKVDVDDAYNTQPKNSTFHHYRQNHKMFRKDALHNVMKSKMFWILLLVLPMIFTFIEFLFTGWGIVNNFVFPNGLSKVTADLVNWFMIMPLLLLSLTVFPTFIAMSRENNQLKRYTMKGMSRKQIYWSYMRFSIVFLIIIMLFWMGPWVYILNIATDSIWLTPEQIAAGEHVFSNPWGLFFGLDFNEVKYKDSINANQIALLWNMNLIQEAIDAGITDITTISYVDSQMVLQFLIDNSNDLETITTEFSKIGIEFSFKNEELTLEILANLSTSSLDVETGIITFSQRIPLLFSTYHEGVDKVPFFILLFLVMFGINSVGFTKAMKVSSSRTLMGWGIGLWIFASIVQGTSSLLYSQIYTFDKIDQKVWNFVVMILLFILKWMFIFSPITIMMVGISLTEGLVSEPSVMVLPDWATKFMEIYANTPPLSDISWMANLNSFLTGIEIYNPLIAPSTITKIFISVSALDAIYWISKTWMFKSRIVSYEASR